MKNGREKQELHNYLSIVLQNLDAQIGIARDECGDEYNYDLSSPQARLAALVSERAMACSILDRFRLTEHPETSRLDFELNDGDDGCSGVTKGTIVVTDHAIEILLKDHGLSGMQTGQNQIVSIERWDGETRAVLFDDINNEEPRIINLNGSLETNRSES